MPLSATRPLAVLAGAAALALAGCGSDGSTGASASSTSSSSAAGSASASPSDDGQLSVVASTDVWGDVAKTVGGDAVEVTSFIDSPDQDPHSYEANARNQLTLSRADVVVENGGGYDDFMETLLSASGSDAQVIDAVDVSGKTAPAGEELNEHVWYDFPTVGMVADAIATQLGQADPQQADAFEQNASAFKQQLQTMEATEASIASTAQGTGVAITEPVPLYLLEACGLVNQTPEEFSEAIEEGTDVPPTVLADTEALFSGQAVKALVYNEQTTGPESDAVLQAAQGAGVAVVPVTETLPEGDDYVQWMTSNLSAVQAAVTS